MSIYRRVSSRAETEVVLFRFYTCSIHAESFAVWWAVVTNFDQWWPCYKYKAVASVSLVPIYALYFGTSGRSRQLG
jgi:hypothetical protein